MTQVLRLGALLGLLALLSSSVGSQVLPGPLDELSSGGNATLGDVTVDSLTITGAGDTSLTTGAFNRDFKIPAGAARQGSTAPTAATVGTSRPLCFDADAEIVFILFEVPSDWDAVSDMGLLVEWFPESGVAIADGETVIWLSNYRAIADGQAITNGTVVSPSATYTQSGAGTDVEQISTTITVDFDNVNQPLAAGDHMHISFSRDMTTDTYASDACIFEWMISYNSTGLGTGGA